MIEIICKDYKDILSTISNDTTILEQMCLYTVVKVLLVKKLIT